MKKNKSMFLPETYEKLRNAFECGMFDMSTTASASGPGVCLDFELDDLVFSLKFKPGVKAFFELSGLVCEEWLSNNAGGYYIKNDNVCLVKSQN